MRKPTMGAMLVAFLTAGALSAGLSACDAEDEAQVHVNRPTAVPTTIFIEPSDAVGTHAAIPALALREQAFGQAQANAACRAGDHRDASVQIFHACPLWLLFAESAEQGCGHAGRHSRTERRSSVKAGPCLRAAEPSDCVRARRSA